MAEQTPPEGVISAASDADGIVIVRVFDAPRELVFKAWTEPERFAAWFGGNSLRLIAPVLQIKNNHHAAHELSAYPSLLN